ncbi:hypothetical protein CCZ01_02775 [Helicobacter monodelphidis]|nr:hypothetical protein CCZ01_02775 [Helicobacter sp. 15-1451]
MEIFQFCHLFWFGTPLSVFSLALISKEWHEILNTAQGSLRGIIYVIAILVFYGGLILAYLKLQCSKNYFALVGIVILLSVLPHKAIFKTPSINNFLPRNDSVSLYNSLRVFTAYFLIYLPKDSSPIKKYQPYEIVEKKTLPPRNIVIILAESVNANNIGILGYKRNTTPLLSELMQQDPYFVAKKAISSSVLTRISTAMFFNLVYEYDNIVHLSQQNFHLFKLAKEAGFTTYYISNQTEAEVIPMASNYIDILRTKESYLFRSNEIGDLVLLEQLDKFLPELEYSENAGNFIVLHQRNPHSPYENSYRAYPEAEVFPLENLTEDVYRENSYDNAMIFNDYIISSIFKKFKSLSMPTYILFVPDHGEAMGEVGDNGYQEFGHSFLSQHVANIPLFATLYNGKDDIYVQKLKDFFYPTHYEIGMLIAEVMGYKIHNPNPILENVFFINGVDIAGNMGHIRVIKDKEKSKIEFQKF